MTKTHTGAIITRTVGIREVFLEEKDSNTKRSEEKVGGREGEKGAPAGGQA